MLLDLVPGLPAGCGLTPPYAALGFAADDSCTITDLLTGQEMFRGKVRNAGSFHATIRPEYLGLYLVEKK